MTFTLVSHLREQLSRFVRTRAERRRKEESEKERLALEVLSYKMYFHTWPDDVFNQEEEARTRGTPVTIETFKTWKIAFDRELAIKKAREDEETIKGLTPKEREEWKKVGTRLSGRCSILYGIHRGFDNCTRSPIIRAWWQEPRG